MTSYAINFGFFLNVTANAPTHLQRCYLLDNIHSFNGTVALLAFQTGIQVDLVAETHEIRQIVDFNPRNRFVFSIVIVDFFDVWFVG